MSLETEVRSGPKQGETESRPRPASASSTLCEKRTVKQQNMQNIGISQTDLTGPRSPSSAEMNLTIFFQHFCLVAFVAEGFTPGLSQNKSQIMHRQLSDIT